MASAPDAVPDIEGPTACGYSTVSVVRAGPAGAGPVWGHLLRRSMTMNAAMRAAATAAAAQATTVTVLSLPEEAVVVADGVVRLSSGTITIDPEVVTEIVYSEK